MASVHHLLIKRSDFYADLQEYQNEAEEHAHEKHLAASLHQSITRGRLTRKYFLYLCFFAEIIQRAFRMHLARKAYRKALKKYVQRMHERYYNNAPAKIQALWRGYMSRKTKFNFRLYRQWLADVTERGESMASKAAEYRIRTKADNLMILEEEARKWLAFVVFKLHHLLRTRNRSGVFSQQSSSELSEFEKLLTAIRYTEYMKSLRRKYDEFVRKHKPQFNNKKVLFPVIGDGHDYWYLSLAEMYELTSIKKADENTRHKPFYHGPQHKEPFLWRKFTPPTDEKRGPFTPRKFKEFKTPRTPLPSAYGDGLTEDQKKDPRFNLYVKHYRPRPDLMEYVDFHVNVLLERRAEIVDFKCEKRSISVDNLFMDNAGKLN